MTDLMSDMISSLNVPPAVEWLLTTAPTRLTSIGFVTSMSAEDFRSELFCKLLEVQRLTGRSPREHAAYYTACLTNHVNLMARKAMAQKRGGISVSLSNVQVEPGSSSEHVRWYHEDRDGLLRCLDDSPTMARAGQLLGQGVSMRKVAEMIGVPATTLNRELKKRCAAFAPEKLDAAGASSGKAHHLLETKPSATGGGATGAIPGGQHGSSSV